jgi:glycosyltransferase involved in cell wall biosynthesis
MDKLLSIVIPTYNRAVELDRQLGWLAQEIQGYEQECEIFISDNCSTDHTPEIIQKWQLAFSQVPYRSSRTPKNIFGMPNLGRCLNAAQGQFVWTIGDDDLIKPGTLATVMGLIKQNPDLALLFLNFYARDEKTQEIVPVLEMQDDQWLDAAFSAQCPNGQEVFVHNLKFNFGAIIFLTATIYRTEHVQASLRLWSDSISNWGGQGFWTGYCANQGKVIITSDSYVECKMGASYWQQEKGIWMKVVYRDVPEVVLKLQEKAGYSQATCREILLKHFKDYKMHQLRNIGNIKSTIKSVARWPRVVAAVWLLLLL